MPDDADSTLPGVRTNSQLYVNPAHGWVVVLHANSRLMGFRMLPRWLRVARGERYLGVDVRPFETSLMELARVFPSFKWAQTYVLDGRGEYRPGMQGALIEQYP